jgi:threonine dehydratase/peptide deformylase
MSLAWRDAQPLPILVEGDPRLTARAAPALALGGDVVDSARRLVATLEDFRGRNGYGRAIAAPQVGIGSRIVAMSLGADPFVLLDPEITWRSEETFEVWDDCLSVPGRLVRVVRSRSISLVYSDIQLRRRAWQRLPEDLAELVQHELDHLDGVLMTARASGADAVQPIARWAELVGSARPRHRLSLDAIREAAGRIDPVFRGSPQFESGALSEALGVRLTVKVETLNPLRSFKGRGAAYFVATSAGAGDVRPIVCASAGNFGQAMAHACARHGIALTVFASENANPFKLARMRALGAEVKLSGHDFDAAKVAAQASASACGARYVEDGKEAAIAEGAGTIAVELLARDDAFDVVLVPLGNGALIGGVGRWLKAASPSTEVIGVSARGAPAMERSFRGGPGGSIVETASADTIADGVAVRVPVPEAVADMHGVVDDVLLVDDATLVEAIDLVRLHLGVELEPAGALGVAALIAFPSRFAGRAIATILTGSNRSAR